MATNTNAADTIKQLNQARNLCLADPNNLYPQIVPGLAPIINANAELELRRWGTDFLAETFASPVLAGEHKQKLATQVLDALKGYLDKADEDAMVVKSVIQIASSIYQYVFRHIIANPGDGQSWQKMADIKSAILRIMDSGSAGVKVCCIKFVQRVVQVQTPGLIADPRRPDQNEISLALVPRDHPVMRPSNLEAEASGLLDRLLDALQDNSSDALLVTATLNSLSSLVRSRASISNKIISTIINFNPFTLAQAQHPMTIKNKILIRSMTRTTMSFLANIIKKNPQHPLAGRIHGTLDRLKQSLVEVFDETRRKRPAPEEPTDGLSDAKRQRLGAEVAFRQPAAPRPPPFPTSGPVTYAQLYTLTPDQSAQGFDVKGIPIEMVSRILPPLLASIESSRLDSAINTVRARFLSLSKPRDAATAAKVAVNNEEEDDYEPDGPAETTEQVLNALDQAADDLPPAARPELALGPFHLPPPPPLTEENTQDLSKGTVTRVFSTLSALDAQPASKPRPTAFTSLTSTAHDRQTWLTTLTRLATRAPAGLDTPSNPRPRFSPASLIRDALFRYIIDDFRRRIDVAISWLNEEWYADRIGAEQASLDASPAAAPQYQKWLYRILDGFLPFLDAKDKLLIRFLSEIPEMDAGVIKRVVKLAADPDRVNLAVQALHYLVLYRPPVREICLDGVEELWRDYEEAKGAAGKVLGRYRPGLLEGVKGEVKIEG
ncbi:mRNA cleavage and polyadenylation specificity factor complex subunit pta1-like protein [Elsinoe fawcettii]|nr:mRNA cleavage and polyadenylation specificity factor complex subunit pta1-like protein [Elsinoe fawcettii]